MKKLRLTDNQIVEALKRAKTCIKVPDLCWKLGISSAVLYRWRAQYGGIDASMMVRMN
jgi:putative transposase